MPDTLSFGSFVSGGGAGVPAELVDGARTAARAVGYAQGWSQGQREATAAHSEVLAAAQADRLAYSELRAERLGEALLAVQAAAGKLEQAVVQLTDEISDKILSAAVELAIALLGQELREPTTSAAAALHRVLRLVPDNEPVTIWLSPQDYQTVTENPLVSKTEAASAGVSALAAIVGAAAASRITVECDPALTVGDAQARSAATSIDARLTEAIQRLREYASNDHAGNDRSTT